MEPTLTHGDEVLVAPSRPPRVGDVVVARHPFKRSVWLIKRLARFDSRGHAELLSEHPTEGTDSRSFGNLSPDLIVGPVTARFDR